MDLAESIAEAGAEHIDGDLVFAAVGDDDIGVTFGGDDKGEVHGSDGAFVLDDGLVEIASAFLDIAGESSDEAQIVVGIDEDLDVHEFSERFDIEDEDAFEHDDGGGFDVDGFFFAAVFFVGVAGFFDGLHGAQGGEMGHEEFGIEGVGVVEVDLLSLFGGEMGEVFVVGILIEKHHLVGWEDLCDLAGDGGLSRAGAASDPDHKGSCHAVLIRYFRLGR